MRLTNAEKELLRPALARYARWETAHDGPVFEAVEEILAGRLAPAVEAAYREGWNDGLRTESATETECWERSEAKEALG